MQTNQQGDPESTVQNKEPLKEEMSQEIREDDSQDEPEENKTAKQKEQPKQVVKSDLNLLGLVHQGTEQMLNTSVYQDSVKGESDDEEKILLNNQHLQEDSFGQNNLLIQRHESNDDRHPHFTDLNQKGENTAKKSVESMISQRSLRNRSDIMPEPLPLIIGELQDEPNHLKGFRRARTFFKNGMPMDGLNQYCPHVEVRDWVCKDCGQRVAQFDTIFDDFQGRCTKYLKVCFENQFLQDFLAEQIPELEARNLAIEKQEIAARNENIGANTKETEDGDKDQDLKSEPKPPSRQFERPNPDVIYQCYQPTNVSELREYMQYCIARDVQEAKRMTVSVQMPKGGTDEEEQVKEETNNEGRKRIQFQDEQQQATTTAQAQQDLLDIKDQSFVPHPISNLIGSGKCKNISNRLSKYVATLEDNQESLIKKYNGDVLLFDSLHESGNLLRADRITSREYRLYMQVDTNTKGHQQWFYFRVRNTQSAKRAKYTFKIMNFTKPGVTGGTGYRKNELFQRVMFKTKKQSDNKWQSIGPEKLEFQKTKVQRRKKDALAAGADSDQDSGVEEALAPGNDGSKQPASSGMRPDEGTDAQKEQLASLKKKRKFFYYSLVFEVSFENDDDVAYFAFSQPYTYTQAISEILEIEETLKPQKSDVVLEIPRKNATQGLQPYTQGVNTLQQNQDGAVGAGFGRSQTLAASQINQLTSNTQEKNGEKTPVARFGVIKEANNNQEGQNNEKGDVEVPGAFSGDLCDEPLDRHPKNGPKPTHGIQFENKNNSLFYKRQELCRTICGLPLWVITISKEKNVKKKPTIIVSSRVHSGETPASFVFKGILEFLTSDNLKAKFLRKFYTFVLIPVLNPDGVVCGNYRNSIAGVDLNRQWINPDYDFHPEVFFTKNLFKQFTEVEKRQIWIYCDIHGHSKKKNSFFYGCNTAANGGFLSWTIVRILPRIFAQQTHLFNLQDCRFKVEPYKIGTGRVVAWKQFSITHSFTLENSFYGFNLGENETQEFTEDEYAKVGSRFVEAIYELHFVWKQIKRELQITNGWLKPKVLLEKTGVPAAQVLADEMAKKKRDEERSLAIKQYQQFLKTYLQGKGAFINPITSTRQGQAKSGGRQAQSLQQASNQNVTHTDSKSKDYQKNQKRESGISQSIQKQQQKMAAGTSPQDRLNMTSKQAEEATSDLKSRNDQTGQTHESTMSRLDENGVESSAQFEDTNQMDLLKQLRGITKFQALWRGHQARRKVKLMLENLKKKRGAKGDKKKISESNIKLRLPKHTSSNTVMASANSQRQKGRLGSESFNKREIGPKQSDMSLNTSSFDGLKIGNPMRESRDTLQSGSNFEYKSTTKKPDLLNRDWRTYFQETELDTAFQRVEIEQQDISEEGSSAGSTSNPSEDNLDATELIDKIYSVDKPKQKQLIEQKKEQETKFMKSVQNQLVVSGQQLYSKILGKPAEDASNVKDSSPSKNAQSGTVSRRGTFKLNRAQNSNGPGGALYKAINGQNGQNQNAEGQNGDANGQNGPQNVYQNQNTNANGQANNEGILSSQALAQRNSSAHSPLNTGNIFGPSDYNFSQANIAFQQIHGRGILLQKDPHGRGGRTQQRATTSHNNSMNYQQANPQNSTLMSHGFFHNGNGYHNPSLSHQVRNMHMNGKGGFGKKENINQVIKDCFITKKFGVRKAQSQIQNTGPQSSAVHSQKGVHKVRIGNVKEQMVYVQHAGKGGRGVNEYTHQPQSTGKGTQSLRKQNRSTRANQNNQRPKSPISMLAADQQSQMYYQRGYINADPNHHMRGAVNGGILSGTSTSFYHSQNIPLSQKMGGHLVNSAMISHQQQLDQYQANLTMNEQALMMGRKRTGRQSAGMGQFQLQSNIQNKMMAQQNALLQHQLASQLSQNQGQQYLQQVQQPHHIDLKQYYTQVQSHNSSQAFVDSRHLVSAGGRRAPTIGTVPNSLGYKSAIPSQMSVDRSNNNMSNTNGMIPQYSIQQNIMNGSSSHQIPQQFFSPQKPPPNANIEIVRYPGYNIQQNQQISALSEPPLPRKQVNKLRTQQNLQQADQEFSLNLNSYANEELRKNGQGAQIKLTIPQQDFESSNDLGQLQDLNRQKAATLNFKQGNQMQTFRITQPNSGTLKKNKNAPIAQSQNQIGAGNQSFDSNLHNYAQEKQNNLNLDINQAVKLPNIGILSTSNENGTQQINKNFQIDPYSVRIRPQQTSLITKSTSGQPDGQNLWSLNSADQNSTSSAAQRVTVQSQKRQSNQVYQNGQIVANVVPQQSEMMARTMPGWQSQTQGQLGIPDSQDLVVNNIRNIQRESKREKQSHVKKVQQQKLQQEAVAHNQAQFVSSNQQQIQQSQILSASLQGSDQQQQQRLLQQTTSQGKVAPTYSKSNIKIQPNLIDHKMANTRVIQNQQSAVQRQQQQNISQQPIQVRLEQRQQTHQGQRYSQQQVVEDGRQRKQNGVQQRQILKSNQGGGGSMNNFLKTKSQEK